MYDTVVHTLLALDIGREQASVSRYHRDSSAADVQVEGLTHEAI